MAKYSVIFLLLINIFNCPYALVSGGNILVILPSVWKSHYLFGRQLVQQLVTQYNHTASIISPHAADSSAEAATADRQAIREIKIKGLDENWLEMGLSFDVEAMHQKSILERFTRLIYAGATNVDLLLDSRPVRELLQSDEVFDLLLVDLYLSDALLGFSFYYKIPTVVLSPTGANSWINQMFGNPENSALDPNRFLPFSERMNLWERSVNTLMNCFEKLTYNFFHMIAQQAVYQKHFESLSKLVNCSKDLPHYRHMANNLSLVLLNSHPILQYPRAYLPNMLEIGGAHLRRDNDTTITQLPKHLEEFISAARDGVIYMSLGADVNMANLSRDKIDALFDVFDNLRDMHFILKWNSQDFEGPLPHNVYLNDWLPQELILAHAKVKVFLTGCGLMSVVEAINGLTPMLALPIYPEQEVLARRLHQQGVAYMLNFDALSYEDLMKGITSLVDNESYVGHLHTMRRLLNADYGSAMAKSMHYVNLMLETNGADYMKSHSNHLNFIRSEMIDVLGIISGGIFCILAVPFFVICCILRRSYYNNIMITKDTKGINSSLSAATTPGSPGAGGSGGSSVGVGYHRVPFIGDLMHRRKRTTGSSVPSGSSSRSSSSSSSGSSLSL